MFRQPPVQHQASPRVTAQLPPPVAASHPSLLLLSESAVSSTRRCPQPRRRTALVAVEQHQAPSRPDSVLSHSVRHRRDRDKDVETSQMSPLERRTAIGMPLSSLRTPGRKLRGSMHDNLEQLENGAPIIWKSHSSLL
ncbi:hypothetical protein AAHA92_15352 [Salvia divinorum]|uniref:Uncharacterized protein n=1 Tax=Salvia divinorum TaxID=28513 RepID=A0ABD1HEI3_SALDI